jgi:hypothetical protein
LGQVVRCRDRIWAVNEVAPSSLPPDPIAGTRPQHLVRMSSLEDDAVLEAIVSLTIEAGGIKLIPYRIMAMTLRLTEDEQAALRERAAAEGISMQEAARRAVREYVVHGRHRDRVSDAARRVMDVHADALRRLGE